MIKLGDEYLLMIEPDQQGHPDKVPVLDDITDKVDYLYSIAKTSDYAFKGVHRTRCGQVSDNKDHILPNGVIMNSLCGYYIRHYRGFIPESEIEKINKFYSELELY